MERLIAGPPAAAGAGDETFKTFHPERTRGFASTGRARAAVPSPDSESPTFL
jgi:hypothetical protein